MIARARGGERRNINRIGSCRADRYAQKRIKEAQAILDALAYEKYSQLNEDEIKALVVDDKWLATLAAAVRGELDRVSQTLTGRIRQLADRYATPPPRLVDEVAMLARRLEEHLNKMGFV